MELGYIYLKRVMGLQRQPSGKLLLSWQHYHKIGFSKAPEERKIDGSLAVKSLIIATWEGPLDVMKNAEKSIHSKTGLLSPYNVKWNKELVDGYVSGEECYFFKQYHTPEECEETLMKTIQGFVDYEHDGYVKPQLYSLPCDDESPSTQRCKQLKIDEIYDQESEVCASAAESPLLFHPVDFTFELRDDDEPASKKRKSSDRVHKDLTRGGLLCVVDPLTWTLNYNYVKLDENGNDTSLPISESLTTFITERQTLSSELLPCKIYRAFAVFLASQISADNPNLSSETLDIYAGKSVVAALINLRMWFPDWDGHVHSITDDMFKPLKRCFCQSHYKYKDADFTIEKWLSGTSGKGAGSMHAALKHLVETQKKLATMEANRQTKEFYVVMGRLDTVHKVRFKYLKDDPHNGRVFDAEEHAYFWKLANNNVADYVGYCEHLHREDSNAIDYRTYSQRLTITSRGGSDQLPEVVMHDPLRSELSL